MERIEYMRLKLSDLPESAVQQYNLEAKATKDGYVYVKIKRGMYGLPWAGLITQQLLEKQLNKKGCKMVRSPWDFGRTNGARYASRSALMILE